MASAGQDRVLRGVHSLTQVSAVVLRPAFRCGAYVTSVEPFRQGTRPKIAASPAAEAGRGVVLFFSYRLTIRLLSVVNCQLIIKKARDANLCVCGVLRVHRGTVSRGTYQYGCYVLLFRGHRIFFRCLLIVRSQTGLRRVRYDRAKVLQVCVCHGLGLSEPPRLVLSSVRCLVRHVNRQGGLVLGGVRGERCLAPTEVMAIAGGLVVEVMYQGGGLREAIHVHIFRV